MSEQITNQPAPPPPEPTCPECGAKVRDRLARRCWMCHEPLDASGRGGGPNPFRLPEPKDDNTGWAVFGAVTLLLIAGLATTAPGILIVLVILAVPALIRMAVVSDRSLGAGQTVTFGSMAIAFLTSVGVVAAVGFATATAFFVTCFAVCMGGLALGGPGLSGLDHAIIPALVLGGAVALAVFVLLIRALSRRKE